MADNRKYNDRIRAFARRTKWEIGSNLYQGGWFAVSRHAAKGEREWRVARYTSNKTVIVESDRSAEYRTSVISWIQRHMAEAGVSPRSAPTRILADRRIPCYPVNSLDLDR